MVVEKSTGPTNAGTKTAQVDLAAVEPAERSEFASARWGIGILVTLAVAYTLFFASSLLLPIFLALFFAVLFQPVVDQLRRLGLPEAVAATLVITFALVCLILGVMAFSAPLDAWIERLPQLLPEIKAKLREIMESVEQAQEVTEEIEDATTMSGDDATAVVAGPRLAERAFGGLTAFTITAFATIVLLYFLLANGRKTVGRMLVAIKDQERRDRWATVIDQIQSEIAAYLMTVALINVVLGIAVAAAMMALGMPNPILWGVLTVLANFLPYIGPLLMFVILGTVSLVSYDSWFEIALPILAFGALAALEGQFLTPSILGKRLTLNPIAVFLSMLFWGWLWGMAGAFLAVPILVAIRVMSRHVDVMAFLRPLLR
jgi:predicted PurR-regulated permease PerM